MKLDLEGNGNDVTLTVGKIVIRALVDSNETLLLPNRFHARIEQIADTELLTCCLSVNGGSFETVATLAIDRDMLLESIRSTVPLPTPLLDMLLSRLAKVQ